MVESDRKDQNLLPRAGLWSLPSLGGASQMALMVKNPPANAGDVRDVGSVLGWEDPLGEDMETHSSILAGRIPWTEEPDGLQSVVAESWTQLKQLSRHTAWVETMNGISLLRLSPTNSFEHQEPGTL